MTRIVAISDTHNYHKKVEIPDGDILIHSGDFTSRGYKHEVEDFLKWFKKQPHETKIFIAGNHDISFEKKEDWLKHILSDLELSGEGVYYLENNELIINDIKFYGSPITPTFGYGWAFNVDRGEKIKEYWNQIPTDTNVLITHGPSIYKLDYTYRDKLFVGCEDLDYRIKEIKPKLHIFGHIHEGYGIEEVDSTIYLNSSICDLQYQPINKPHVIDI